MKRVPYLDKALPVHFTVGISQFTRFIVLADAGSPTVRKTLSKEPLILWEDGEKPDPRSGMENTPLLTSLPSRFANR